MLSSLKIENVAVIEKAEIFFSSGLNILTGETGAGKSIVIDAINAILGERTSREIIRDGALKAKVTAEFTDVDSAVFKVLEEFDIECDDGVVLISRVIYADGRNNCKINGQTVTVSMLRQIGANLITICGQHDSQHLLLKEKQGDFIDKLADCEELLLSYRETLTEIKKVRRELRRMLNADDDKQRRMEFLRFQIDEIVQANITVGEKKKLTDEKKMIQNRERLMALLSGCDSLINGSDENGGVSSMLYSLADSLQQLAKLDGRFQIFCDSVTDFRYILDDCASGVSDLLESFSDGGFDINTVEERLDVIYRISKKYGDTEEEILAYLDKITAEFDEISMSDEIIDSLQQQYTDLEAELLKRGCFLSDARKMAAAEFEKSVTQELAFLDMPRAVFSVCFSDSPATENGIDDMEFLFSANAGQEPKPLSKIASGGELSRVMLAIRCVLSDKDVVSSMIFDEIDTGVSGRAAHKIAYKLSELSKSKQVICVTHLAQIASCADNHLYIEKSTVDGGTFTKVTSLDYEARVYEIARIMGGDAITETTLNSARELIDFLH